MHFLPSLALTLASVQLSAAVAIDCPNDQWKVGQTVPTSSGPVSGHAASTEKEVSEYLGIPYAEPPVGKLRFQPPVAFKSQKPISGKNFGYACVPSNIAPDNKTEQAILAKKWGITPNGETNIIQIADPPLPHNEDCLFLNVWTKPQTGDKKKAVLVWIHGGSFIEGGSSLPWYNGQYFAGQEDVVLVSLNYRLNLFGFPGYPGGEQNLGLLDQRLAVEWVHQNIAAFGGDPSRITIFGQSAGASSVDHYSYAWAHDPLIHATIPQSGTVAIGVRTQANATQYWYNASQALGCGDAKTGAQKVFDCMLTKPAESIASVLVGSTGTDLPYAPTVDGKLVFSDYKSRKPAKLPLLIGNADNEYGLFKVFSDASPPESFWEGLNQQSFDCPAAARAAISLKEGNPTWRYRYMGVFPNMIIATNPPSGAYHASEIPVLFGTAFQKPIPSTAAENAIGRTLRGAWATFAKDPVRGLLRYDGGWPEYVANKDTLARLGFENKTGTYLFKGDFYDTGCQNISIIL